MGDEPKTLSTQRVMHFKLETALDSVSRASHRSKALIIASDTMTSTCVADTDGNFAFFNRGKPESAEEIQRTFRSMTLIAQRTKTTPGYRVESSSGSVFIGEEGPEISTAIQSCRISLDQGRLENLCTERGFLGYLEKFHKFYSSNTYAKAGMQSVDPLDLSTGISLPVLVCMDIVSSIDGVGRGEDAFLKKLTCAIFIVGIGISPVVIKRYCPDVEVLVNQWQWLNNVAERALQGGVQCIQ